MGVVVDAEKTQAVEVDTNHARNPTRAGLASARHTPFMDAKDSSLMKG